MALDKKKTPCGTLYGVGVGPGDPGLLTLKALEALSAAGVIAVPSSGNAGGATHMALSIISPVVSINQKEILRLVFPMTHDGKEIEKARSEAGDKVIERLKNGLDVAFITLGDPMLYSTFSPVAAIVKKRFKDAAIRVIPGVNSFSAAAALACLPIAEHDERIAVLPASYDMESVKEALRSFDTVILMKVNKVFGELVGVLEEKGFSAVFASRVGFSDELILTDIKDVKAASPGYFSLIIAKKRHNDAK
ncbi:MAG: precorrin-2 C(20)-methyltransferase [Deltaproteobacteria bacterium]